MSICGTTVAVAAACLVLVSGWGVAAGARAETEPAAVPVTPAPGLATDAVAVPPGVPESALPPTTLLHAAWTLPWTDAAGLTAYLNGVEDPTGPEFRDFLSYAQFVASYAPTSAEVASVEAALRSYNATDLTVSPDRLTVEGVIPAGSLAQMLGVRLVKFLADDRTVYTALGVPTLPAALAGRLSGVTGLSNAATVGTDLGVVDQAPVAPGGSGSSGFVYDPTTGADYYIGSDYAQAYLADQLWPGTATVGNATFPTHLAVATLLAGSFNTTYGQDLPPWDPSVVAAYFNDTFPSSWPHPIAKGVPVAISGAPTPPLPGSLGNYTDDTGDEFENSLDLEMAGSLAPGATVTNFYFDGSLLAGSPSLGDVAEYFSSDLAAALAYNYAPENLSAVSGSFGISDLDDPAWDSELTVAAGTGVTVVLATGDDGNAPNSYHPDRPFGAGTLWPASSATNTSGAVAVGGVSLTLAGAPTGEFNDSGLNVSYDAHLASVNGSAFTSMGAWYDAGDGAAVGTVGGVSSVYPEPWWQFDSAAQPAIVNATTAVGGTALGRAEPDVAMPANNTIAYVLANGTGTVYFAVLEGTSVAAPVLAGLLTSIVAVESQRLGRFVPLGFVDPELYRIASFYAAHANPVTDPFIDVTQGANYAFSAGPGWDAATGWGGVLAPRLLAADLNLTISDYVYQGPTPGLPAASSGSGVPWTTVELVLGVGAAAALAAVLVFARPRRGRAKYPYTPPPAGAGGTTGTGSIATFVCPYCGAERPSEPVRCPRCGAF